MHSVIGLGFRMVDQADVVLVNLSLNLVRNTTYRAYIHRTPII